MKEERKNELQIKQRRWLPYVIATIVLAAITVLVGWARDGFTDTDTHLLLRDWCDAFFVSGVLGLGFGLLMLASNGGVFDIFAYGAIVFFNLFKKDPLDRKYGGYYEYTQARRQKKRSFWFLVIVGGAYLLVCAILLILFYFL